MMKKYLISDYGSSIDDGKVSDKNRNMEKEIAELSLVAVQMMKYLIKTEIKMEKREGKVPQSESSTVTKDTEDSSTSNGRGSKTYY